MATIYISSTFEDLKDYREAVYLTLRADHKVIAMEDYVARDERPLAKCRRDIADCDLYVGVFAWRYGYVPEYDNPDRLSITELEYRHAKTGGKECFVFLLDEAVKWSLPMADYHTGHGERGELIRRLRDELGKNMVVGFFRNPDNLAKLVLEAVNKRNKRIYARKREEESWLHIAQLTPDEKIVVDKQIGQTHLLVINDDICNAATDIVVSSDDNYFTARYGVSKMLLDKLGEGVRRELERYRKAGFRQNESGFRQGQVAITTGGQWGRRAVIHAAVIDLDRNHYPTREAIQTVTRRSLACAVALGAQSIAFPVLGGGYATKHMNPRACVNAIATEILAFMDGPDRDRGQLSGINLYIFNPQDNAGLPEALQEIGGF